MELVDLYDIHHNKVDGVKEKKSLVKGEFRLSSFIWVMNDKNEILIQQRLKTAKKAPNMWGTTAGGVISGETSLQGAKRELFEELGIVANEDDMRFIGSYMRVRDFVEIWLLKANVDIRDLKLQEDEVQDAKWVSISEFEKMLDQGIGIRSGYDIFKSYYDDYYMHYENDN